jgi:hypothetical protein
VGITLETIRLLLRAVKFEIRNPKFEILNSRLKTRRREPMWPQPGIAGERPPAHGGASPRPQGARNSTLKALNFQLNMILLPVE